MRRAAKIFPCAFCPAKDSRQPDHATGCPRFPDLSRDELVAIARNVERAWGGGEVMDAFATDAFDRRSKETRAAMRAKGAA
jgi:hypothetical protein